MADARDLLNAWEGALRGLRGVTAPATDVLETALRRQMEFDRALVGRVMAPLNVVLDALEQTAAAMHNQAKAFESASAAFKQSAELLEVQATTLERAIEALRDPAEFVKSAGGLIDR